MKRSAHIQEELQALGLQHLLELPTSMPFAVPAHYFSETTMLLQSIASNKENDFLPNTNSKAMPFAAPDAAYFAGLSDSILNKINADPLEALPKENPFVLPAGYFDELPNAILAKAKMSENKSTNKRIPIFSYVQMAASIALVFFVGLAILRSSEPKLSAKHTEMNSISKAEIAAYVDNNLDEFDTDLILNTLAKNKSDNKIIGSDDLTKEEIRNYLNENGWN